MTYEGKVVLNYKLTKKLGEGGFGAVYLAEQVDLGRRAAIKILHHQFASQPAVVERFFREARAVCEIGHRAIVAIENFGRLETGEPFYLMEFFAGGAINQITTERWLTSDQLVAIFDPIADALGAAHAKNIIHRDLKPDNIMVRIANDRVADVRLLDFGIAKLLDGDASRSMTGSAMGTPSYMPPEQALDAKNVDARADVYSFGATVYAAVCGRPPFDGSSVAAILLAVQQSTAPLLPSMRPDTTPELDAAIRRCLAKQPDHRPRSIIDAWSAIRSELVRANLTQAPVRPNPLIAATMAHTPAPMAVATPVPGEAITAPVPSAPPVPGAISAMAPQPAIGIDQAATTPEVGSASSPLRTLAIAIVTILGLAAVAITLVIVSSKGSKDSPASSGDSSAGSDSAGAVPPKLRAVLATDEAVSVHILSDGAIAVSGSDRSQEVSVTEQQLEAVLGAIVVSDAARHVVLVSTTASLNDRALSMLARARKLGLTNVGISAVDTGFDLYVTPPGKHRWRLDGEPRTDAMPSAIRGIEPGRHKIDIDAAPGLLSESRDVVVELGKAPKIEITLQPTEVVDASVGRTVHTPDARVSRSLGEGAGVQAPPDAKAPDPKAQPGGACSEASFAASTAKTEAEVDAMLGRLNSCQGKFDNATFKRLQQALVQRKLSL